MDCKQPELAKTVLYQITYFLFPAPFHFPNVYVSLALDAAFS